MKGLIVLGGGGHAKVLIETLLLMSANIIGFTDVLDKPDIFGVPRLGDDHEVSFYSPGEVSLVNGLGSVGDCSRRKAIFEKYKLAGYRFTSVIHPNAVISPSAVLGEGVQIMAGAVIQTGVSIGSNTIVNTRAVIDHDCMLGEHVHVAPGATLSGHVMVESEAHIGTGAVIIQGLSIGKRSLVGAGAVVTKDVPGGSRVAGVPAKPF